MPMSASPFSRFNGRRDFSHLLLEIVYGGVGWLTCDFVKGKEGNSGPYCFPDGGFIGCG